MYQRLCDNYNITYSWFKLFHLMLMKLYYRTDIRYMRRIYELTQPLSDMLRKANFTVVVSGSLICAFEGRELVAVMVGDYYTKTMLLVNAKGTQTQVHNLLDLAGWSVYSIQDVLYYSQELKFVGINEDSIKAIKEQESQRSYLGELQ